MRIKRLVAGIATGAIAFTLVGCGTTTIVPEKHMDTISEYAAIKLLKYDANNRSRLVDEATIEEADRRQEAWDKADVIEPTLKPTPEGMDPVEDVPVIGDGEKNDSTCSSLEQYFSTPDGISLQYKDYTLCTSYSQSPGDAIVLEASEGNELLVMRFQLNNTTNQEKEVDLFAKKARYRITVNGEYVCSAMRTLLMNDMTTYVSALQGQSSDEVVLVTEISNEITEQLSSIELYMKNESNIYTIQIL